MTKKAKRYSEEFKAEAVKTIESNGGNFSTTARHLGLPIQILANWQRKANQGKLKGTKQYYPELVSALEEIKRLKTRIEACTRRTRDTKKSYGVLCETRSVRYAFIDHHKYEFSITSM